LESALANAKSAGAPLYPQVDAGMSASKAQTLTRSASGMDDFDGFSRNHSTSLGLSLDVAWEADVWGRLSSLKSAALADVESARADLRSAKLSLAGQVAKSWFALNESALQLGLTEETVRSYLQTAQLVRERFERGLAPAGDVHLARSQKAGAEARLEQAKLVFENALRGLEILLGRYPSAELNVSRELTKLENPIPAGLPSELLERRPDLVSAERKVASAASRLKSAQAARLPRLSLTASGGTTSDALRDLIDPKYSIWNFLINLVQPIIDGGKLAADQEYAMAQTKSALAAYGKAALTAFREVENALSAEILLKSQEQALQIALEEARLAYERIRNQYRSGLTDYLNVLESQRNFFDARAKALGIQRERLENRVNLFLALGGNFKKDTP
jgi:NodT family efflux transporter outer membrane factor (OMF) lipoprotein